MSVQTADVRGARATGWWGMLLFVAAELTLFGAALIGYHYLRFRSPTWPPPGIEQPDLALGGVATLLLLASSVPMVWAERSAARGRWTSFRIGLALAVVMAMVFLGIQTYEYTVAEFSYRTDAYGSLFFTITALHGLHVIGAILIAAMLFARSLAGHFDPEHHVAVQTGALYWHFVGLVWVAIVLSLYVSPRF